MPKEFENRPLSTLQAQSLQIEIDDHGKFYGKLIALAMWGQTAELDQRLVNERKPNLWALRAAVTRLLPIIEAHLSHLPGSYN